MYSVVVLCLVCKLGVVDLVCGVLEKYVSVLRLSVVLSHCTGIFMQHLNLTS